MREWAADLVKLGVRLLLSLWRTSADGKAKGHAEAQPFVNHARREPCATRDKARMGSPVHLVKDAFAPSQRNGGRQPSTREAVETAIDLTKEDRAASWDRLAKRAELEQRLPKLTGHKAPEGWN